MIFTVWSHDTYQGLTLVKGDHPPCLVDGSLLHKLNKKIDLLHARDWEEATLLFDKLRSEGALS